MTKAELKIYKRSYNSAYKRLRNPRCDCSRPATTWSGNDGICDRCAQIHDVVYHYAPRDRNAPGEYEEAETIWSRMSLAESLTLKIQSAVEFVGDKLVVTGHGNYEIRLLTS